MQYLSMGDSDQVLEEIIQIHNGLDPIEVETREARVASFRDEFEKLSAILLLSEAIDDKLVQRFLLSTVIRARELERELGSSYFSDISLPRDRDQLLEDANVVLTAYAKSKYGASILINALRRGLLPEKESLSRPYATWETADSHPHIDEIRAEYPIIIPVGKEAGEITAKVKISWLDFYRSQDQYLSIVTGRAKPVSVN